MFNLFVGSANWVKLFFETTISKPFSFVNSVALIFHFSNMVHSFTGLALL